MKKPRIARIGDHSHPWVCWWNEGYGFKCAFTSWIEAVWYALEINPVRLSAAELAQLRRMRAQQS
jgi:hypothetical protein